jgi:multidrug resistance efflux pump
MNETANNTPKPAGNLSDRVRSLRLGDGHAEQAGSSWWWAPWAVCAVLALTTVVFAMEALSPIDDELLKKLADERGLNVGKPATPGAPGSGLTLPGMAASSDAEPALESKGYIVPISLIQVSPKISGTVMKLNIEEGKEVEKGYVLAELEDVEYKSDFQRLQGVQRAAQARLEELRKYRDDEILQAKADLDDAIAQRDQWQSKYKRYVILKVRGAVAPEEFENTESNYKSMDSRVQRMQLAFELLKKGPRDEKINAAQAEISQADADVRKAEWRFNNTRVVAPIAGVILTKKTEEGNIVNPSAFSNGLSASLCEMADLFRMEVDLAIAERDIAKVFKDQECRIRAEAFPNRIYTGHVSRIMPIGDRGKSSVAVRVVINFPAVDGKGRPLAQERQGEYLRPEMGAIVTFLNRKAKAV